MSEYDHVVALQFLAFSPIIGRVGEEKEKKKGRAPATRGELIAFASEVGISIAIPLAILAFVGRWVDKQYGTTPLFLIIGLLLSIVSTSIIIWRKVRHFL